MAERRARKRTGRLLDSIFDSTTRTIQEMEAKLGCPPHWHNADGTLNAHVVITRLGMRLTFEEDYYTTHNYQEVNRVLSEAIHQ